MIFSALSNVFIRSLSAICERKLSSHVFIQEGIQWMEFIDSHAVKYRGPVFSKIECIQGLNVGMHSDTVFSAAKGGILFAWQDGTLSIPRLFLYQDCCNMSLQTRYIKIIAYSVS